MKIVALGVNHRTAPVGLRERVAFTSEQALAAAGALKHHGVLDEAVVLSTCNRSELYGVPARGRNDVFDALEGFFLSFHRMPSAELDGCFYRYSDGEAARHLFRVASGLDSMLLGEAEILGQVRQAYRVALESRVTGPVLNRLFQAALEVGKRVRSQTELGAGPMSVALAAVKLAEQIFGRLNESSALILGAGAMGEQVVEHLRQRSVARLLVANRSPERAAALAARFQGEAVGWEKLASVVAVPDIIVSSVGESPNLLDREMLERAMHRRNSRALFVLDLGVPRNIAPEAGKLYNAYLYNIDDLTGIVEQNRRARQEEIPRAELLVEEHLAKFEDWQAGVEVVALLEELRAKLQSERAEFLSERLRRLRHLSSEERQRLESLTEELVDLALRAPEAKLRNPAALRRKLANIEVVREVFGLPREQS
jgi:glutamyl-tRNA reductase